MQPSQAPVVTKGEGRAGPGWSKMILCCFFLQADPLPQVNLTSQQVFSALDFLTQGVEGSI